MSAARSEAEEYTRWIERADAGLHDELAAFANDEEKRHDAFYRTLAFGTAGLRGVLGAGPNRMNVHTVAQATQGLADYLNANAAGAEGAAGTHPSVAIARDSRLQGEEFCRVAAGVLAANGIRALLYPRIEPTPALSFAVRDLGCSAGINMTASHNPAEYNGYKVYGPDGCQITTEAARAIQEAIAQRDIFDGVRCLDFDEGAAGGLIAWIGEDTLDRYLDAVASQSLDGNADAADASDAAAGAAGAADAPATPQPLKLAYTPLHGAGLECAMRIFERIGVTDVAVEPAQAQADGTFPTCPYPNPETREALERGLALAAAEHADLLIATDPDADRTGIAVVKDGAPLLLTGNETGILLTDYICKRRLERGEELRDKVAVTTIVSSSMMDALCTKYGFELRRTLTGFKYIGEQIGLLEAAGEADRFIFGFEESYGYLAGGYVRDKDAIVASMLICEMARWYRAQGMDLADAMAALYAEHGHYANKTISLAYPGAAGAQKMRDLTAGLRARQPERIADLAVEGFTDYASGAALPVRGGRGTAPAQTMPAADVIEFALEGDAKLIVRPSGTEPKIKAYLFARAATHGEADALIARLETAARELLA